MWKRAIGVSLTVWICAGSSLSQTAPAGIRFTGASGHSSHHHFARTLNPGFPFWPDYLPSNETAPSVIVVQAPAAPAERPATEPDELKSAAPLLIEWQGDRYVRRTSADANSRASQPDYVADAKPAAAATTRALVANNPGKKSDTPPTTFIFRDGHHEQSSDYSIISGIIYARLDYWTTGQWSKQICLSDLDVPATVKANQDQGITFRVPRAPNEIITRP